MTSSTMPLLSIHTSHHTACLGCPVSQRASPLPGFRIVVAPRSPHRPHPQPRFLHVTEESVLISPQISPSPRTRNCPSSYNDSSLSFYSAILSPFFSWNIPPLPPHPGELKWLTGEPLGGRNAPLEWWLQDVQGQGTNSNVFETMNENAVLSMSEETCAILRDLG